MSEQEQEVETEAETETELEAEVEKRDWEAEARQMGWKPKEQWVGREGDWRTAEEYVRKGEEFLPFVKANLERERARNAEIEAKSEERLKRLEDSYIRAMERQKVQHEAETKAIKAQMEAAVEAGDVAAYKALDKRREALGEAPQVPEKPKEPTGTDHPVVVEWGRKNPWFYSDPAMRSLAIGVAGRVAQGGGDVHAQVKAAEDEVRRRFPENFPSLNGANRTETGGQAPRPSARSREKGAAELPPEARQAFKEFVRMGVYKQDDIARYAKSYWEQE